MAVIILKIAKIKTVQKAPIYPLPDSPIYLLSTFYSFVKCACTHTSLYTHISEPFEGKLHISWPFIPKHFGTS